MKKCILLLALLISVNAVSQNINRIEVSGKIIVEGNDVLGITIFNTSSNTGTITDENGEFKLKVSLKDNIEVSALQYQNISFEVNAAIIKSKKMKLFLIEEINRLDEIIVFTKGLSGNLNTDLEANKVNFFYLHNYLCTRDGIFETNCIALDQLKFAGILKNVKDNCLVVCDDYSLQEATGVKKAIDESVKEYSCNFKVAANRFACLSKK